MRFPAEPQISNFRKAETWLVKHHFITVESSARIGALPRCLNEVTADARFLPARKRKWLYIGYFGLYMQQTLLLTLEGDI
jgi:hypothetical protein